MPHTRDTLDSAPGLPLRGHLFLALFFVGVLIVTTSLFLYGLHTRLGYSYAVHAAIFYAFSDDNKYLFFLSAALTAGLTYFIYRCLADRHRRGLKLVPWLMKIAIVAALTVYVIEVLQIDISFATSEEYAKGSRPE
jgi:hypothetical protein